MSIERGANTALIETEPQGTDIMIKTFLQDENGATAIEYGLIAALVAVACITALQTVGQNLIATFTQVSDNLAVPGN